MNCKAISFLDKCSMSAKYVRNNWPWSTAMKILQNLKNLLFWLNFKENDTGLQKILNLSKKSGKNWNPFRLLNSGPAMHSLRLANIKFDVQI